MEKVIKMLDITVDVDSMRAWLDYCNCPPSVARMLPGHPHCWCCGILLHHCGSETTRRFLWNSVVAWYTATLPHVVVDDGAAAAATAAIVVRNNDAVVVAS